MKKGGGLHHARPDCWPPTKRPRATPGGLIAAGVTCLSRREGVPPCLRTSPPLGGTLGSEESGSQTEARGHLGQGSIQAASSSVPTKGPARKATAKG